ncbi:MAG: OmpA family protein [Bacteroidota bacterium]|nr:OmpA family protein [Bacteroidota bacterium]
MRYMAHKAQEKTWQVSYIDLLTAMLAAFTLLLALSVPDQSKLDSLASSVSDAAKRQQNLGTLSKDLQQVIQNNKALQGQVSVVMTDQGIELRFGSNLLFPPGQAKLSQQGYDAIYSVGRILGYFVKARDAYIAVEGHTDDTPVKANSEFKSNWELSASRALEVLHYLQDTVQIESKRLSATGYGDARPQNKQRDPVTGQFTELARNDNRRVVIRIYYYRQI